MSEISIQSHRGPYTAYSGSHERMGELLESRFPKAAAVFVADSKVLRLHEGVRRSIGSRPLLEVDALETNKTMEFALARVLPFFLESKVSRASVVVALGGGIIQDLVAFSASVFYRGVPWLFYPTTLLAQADSCIGSKSSINMQKSKNSIGTFFPPKSVVIDPAFLRTLEDIDFRSGVGEILKVHLMESADACATLAEEMPSLLARDATTTLRAAWRSLGFKKKYIEKDEFDEGYRNVLNYGHCFGHALEAATSYKIAHGMAVSYGMEVANRLSELMGLLSAEDRERMTKLIAPNLVQQEVARAIRFDELLPYLQKDKKNVGSQLGMILTEGFGRTKKVVGVDPAKIEQVWDAYRGSL